MPQKAFIVPLFDPGLNHCARLESIQKQFVLFSLRKLGLTDRFSLPQLQRPPPANQSEDLGS